MAGIGFEIRKILKKNSLLSVFQAYGYAGIIGSGPWLLSILALMVIGILSVGIVLPQSLIIQFLVSVTYMMAASLILTGGLQLMLTRFAADLFFRRQDQQVLPNLLGSLLLTTIAALVIALLVWPFLPLPALSKLLLIAGFVCLCNQWLGVIFLSGMKEYRAIVLVMIGGYATMILLASMLRFWGLDGLYCSFFVGEAILMFSFLLMIVRRYPGDRLIRFDFLRPDQVFYGLFFCGLFYNAGVWADKIIFWFMPYTSVEILGPMRASPIYDLPIFLAYLSVIPGMAVFLVRMETDFVEHYDHFYHAVRTDSSLDEIYQLKDNMVRTAQAGIYEIFKVQGITLVFLLLWGGELLQYFGIDVNYRSLLNIDLVGVALQVVMLSVFNIMYYLDKRKSVLVLNGLFLAANTLFTLLTIYLGPYFYGYGFVLACLVTTVAGLLWLNKQFHELEYETFMKQRG
ncbi:exopolysaccharide Pel transporter PelG [Vibrio quintilis]|uniref:Histidine kinase n=1 Tax=Vibrio quintilis TaxID=1117707 RepID=A0A1M7YWD8_9VIBR|nr:exopolysaccharide Pel transporter PelG [Vibrio quintilis]SHO56902.1 hypothetical protein VQ7734_02671 [Vibrio quintilis]